MGERAGLRAASVAVVAAALIAGGCGGDGDVSVKLGPVARLPAKERVDFGDVAPGASASKTVTVKNDSDEPQTVTALDTTGVGGDAEITGGTCDVGENLAPDEECTVTMTFTAKRRGADSAVLSVGRTVCCRPGTTTTTAPPPPSPPSPPPTTTGTTPTPTTTGTTPLTTSSPPSSPATPTTTIPGG